MKRVLGSIIFLFVVLNISAESLQNKDIFLKFKKTHSKSVAIVASLESDHSITLSFNQEFNQLLVCLVDSAGVVSYNTTIDAEEGSLFSISLVGIPEGEYIISLTNAENEVSGKFIIEKDN